MESRLIIFLIFLTVLASALSLATYRKYFDPSKAVVLSSNYVHEKQKAIADAAKPKVEQPVTKKAVMSFATEEEKRGYEVYMKTGQCYSCHGKQGQGLESQVTPRLAGQYDWYLYEQLVAFKTKTRINVKMNPYLRRLEDQDFKDVAAYLSRLKN